MNVVEREIVIPVSEKIQLKGNLTVPDGAGSIVIFSHGSGSSRMSPRNNFVADVLNKQKIATLLTDLMTEQEDSIYENRFDIEFLTGRLIYVTHHVFRLAQLKDFSIGYFGASTGAASALQAAALLGNKLGAVVSRGGRPDLAESYLNLVKASTLLIVGSRDVSVIELNQFAFSLLECEKELSIVNGAGHLFEEEGKLEEVAEMASNWFVKHLKRKSNFH